MRKKRKSNKKNTFIFCDLRKNEMEISFFLKKLRNKCKKKPTTKKKTERPKKVKRSKKR